MGIYKVNTTTGELYRVDKRWPLKAGRVRINAPNFKAAHALLTRIETSISY